ncbi:MAG TPA: hypothetical protein VMT15_07420 [Bryobacteraceae bacterium]|nr:hypothetical protein [Bryobacteraceae bacterium]
MTLREIMEASQYSLPQREKEAALLDPLNELTRRHGEACPEYERLLSVLYRGRSRATCLEEVPYVPVGLFKTHALRSIPAERVFKTLTSSGTTGQAVSRIFLDQETASLQSVALSRIMMHALGGNRLPMLIADTDTLIKNRETFSARGAGVLGMMTFGRNHLYVLDSEMGLKLDELQSFLKRFGDAPFLIFGFTFMVWAHFYQRIRLLGLDLSQGILIHSGGWKNLQESAVGNAEFKAHFRRDTGLERIYNFYGMAEQVGSVFLEGEDGLLYPPNFADILIRDPETLEVVPTGTPGLIEVLSLLPLSYPGHAILTEDLGVVEHIDAGSCGRCGKAFRVLGRLPKAELRGCADTHAKELAQ